jgi:hypothetical protein
MTGRALGEALGERGYKKIKKTDGWKFTGIKLKPSAYQTDVDTRNNSRYEYK